MARLSPAPKRNPSDLYRRVVVDGVEVRAVREPVKLIHPCSSAYPIYVAGVRRGFLVHQQPGWRGYGHNGWAVRCQTGAGGIGEHPWATSRLPGADGVDDVLRHVPRLITDGKMPTQAEQAAWEAADQERQAETARLRAIEDQRRAARYAREAVERVERWDEMMAGLESLRDRDDLTNLERVGLERAVERLQQHAPARPAGPTPESTSPSTDQQQGAES